MNRSSRRPWCRGRRRTRCGLRACVNRGYRSECWFCFQWCLPSNGDPPPHYSKFLVLIVDRRQSQRTNGRHAELGKLHRQRHALREELWHRLREQIPGLALNGHEIERLPNTFNIRFPGFRGSAILAKAPEIAASTGSACHERGESASSVLLAMGLTAEDALGAVHLSLGRGTTEEDIRTTADSISLAWQRLSG